MRSFFMEEEKGLLTVGDFFKVVFNRKWIVLAVTIVAIALGVVLNSFVLNPAKESYQIYFTMEYPDKGDVYPDGKVFCFQDMVSLEYLQAVKASDKDFADIDVEGMNKENDVYIYQTSRSLGEAETETQTLTVNEKTYEYRLLVAAKYFNDTKSADKFLRAIASYPAKYNEEAVSDVDFKKNLSAYNDDAVKKYEEKLNMLNEEYQFLVGKYESLIGAYGDALEVNGKKLSVWLGDLQTAYGSYERQRLSKELSQYGYAFNDDVAADTIDDLVYELQTNAYKIEENTEMYKALVSGGVSAETTILTTISSLRERNVDIEAKLKYFGVEHNGYLADGSIDKSVAIWTWSQDKTSAQYLKYAQESSQFGTRLNAVKASLEEQADICKSVVEQAYNQQTKIVFSSSITELLGGTSNVTVAIVSALLGIIVVAAIVLIADMPKYAKRKKAASLVCPQTSSTCLYAEAAASQTEQEEEKLVTVSDLVGSDGEEEE